MKRLFALLLLLSIVEFSICQDSTFTISKVVTVDSVSKGDLYKRAKTWVVTTYNSAQNVIQMDDKEDATIVVKASFPVTAKAGLMTRQNEGNVKYTLTIQCKDGKYKYSLENFIHECFVGYGSGGNLNNEKPDCAGGLCPKAGWEDIKGQARTYAEELSNSLTSGINTNPSKGSEW